MTFEIYIIAGVLLGILVLILLLAELVIMGMRFADGMCGPDDEDEEEDQQ